VGYDDQQSFAAVMVLVLAAGGSSAQENDVLANLRKVLGESVPRSLRVVAAGSQYLPSAADRSTSARPHSHGGAGDRFHRGTPAGTVRHCRHATDAAQPVRMDSRIVTTRRRGRQYALWMTPYARILVVHAVTAGEAAAPQATHN
jgi:hypothetical protein